MVHLPIRVEFRSDEAESGWGAFTRHMESLLHMLETSIWPVDAEADVMPTLMPFEYKTESGEEDERVLKSLLMMLTLGLQGEAFKWKYKFDFDVFWNEHAKAYNVILNSVRRMWHRGLDIPKNDAPVAGAGAGTTADETHSAVAELASADFTPPAEE